MDKKHNFKVGTKLILPRTKRIRTVEGYDKQYYVLSSENYPTHTFSQRFVETNCVELEIYNSPLYQALNEKEEND
jgi:hypothetical protein